MQAKKISRKVSVTDQISAAWDLNGLKLSPDLLWSSGSANHWRNKTEVFLKLRLKVIKVSTVNYGGIDVNGHKPSHFTDNSLNSGSHCGFVLLQSNTGEVAPDAS